MILGYRDKRTAQFAAGDHAVAAQEAGATIDALPVRPGLVPPAPGHGSRVPGR